MTKPILVIMAGGRGERFWPRSRRKFPKQLLNLVSDESLLQEAVGRIRPMTDDDRIFVVINRDYAEAVRKQLPFLPDENILIEPVGRNTAPCVGLATLYAMQKFGAEDPSIAFLPSDPVIFNPDEMRHVLQAGFHYSHDSDSGVIFGMWPNRPETGYGYIQLGTELGCKDGVPYHLVAAFKEKPDRATAEAYIESKSYLWNGGIFLWRLNVMWEEIRKYMPELAAGLEKIRPGLGTPDETRLLEEVYPTLPAESFDYGVLEKTTDLVVIPSNFGWDDLGSWSTLERMRQPDSAGNVVEGTHIGVETNGCIIYSPAKTVTTLGVQDLIIVEMDDVLMVCAKEKAQEIKKILAALKEKGRDDLL